MKLNQLQEAKRYLKKSIELTKNELPYIALAKVCLLEDRGTEAQNAYIAALRYTKHSRLLFPVLMQFAITARLTSQMSCTCRLNSTVVGR